MEGIVRSAKIPERERHYRRLLASQARSGLSIYEFAERVGIPRGTLSFWKFKIRQLDRTRAAPRPATAIPRREARRVGEPLPSFLPVNVVEGVASAHEAASSRTRPGYEVLLRCGRVVRVPSHFEAESLTTLVRALEGTC